MYRVNFKGVATFYIDSQKYGWTLKIAEMWLRFDSAF